MDGGSAELRGFVTRGFCLMMTSLLSLLSSHESSEMPLPFPTPPRAFEIHPPGGRKENVGGWVGRSQKGMPRSHGASECVYKTFNLYSRLTFTVRLSNM